jgi:hypothetical protein
LREFISKSVVTRAYASGKADGFELHVHIGSAVGVLVNARGIARTFISLNTLTGLVKRLGATQFDVVIGAFNTSEPAPRVKVSKTKPSLAKSAKKSLIKK